MHHEKQNISGNWDRGFALDFHNTAYQGDPLKSSPMKELLAAAGRGDAAAFHKVVDAAARHLSPKIFASLYAYDVVVPVPPSRRLGPARPGDLVFELARHIAARQGLRLFCGVRTTRSVPSLVGVQDPEERARLRSDLYALEDAEAIAGKRVLVVDDVFHTGATLNAVVRTLREQGAPETVDVLTMTTGGGVKRHTTLAAEADREMAEIYHEFSVADGEDAYLMDGVSIQAPGTP